MDLVNRFQSLLELYRANQATGSDPLGVMLEKTISPTEAIINGRATILAGTNNYLGLTFDPDCIEAAIEALRLEGTGTTGSRIANGTYARHRALEQELAAFFGRAHALVFSTGYQANLGTISTLAGHHDFIVGTFSKSAGTIGGFCVSNVESFDTFKITSRPFMFSASLPPSVVAAASAALKIIVGRPELRARLRANVEFLYNELRAAGFILGPDPSPIIAVSVPDLASGVALWRSPLDQGVYVNLAVPPATPHGRTLLRCSVLAVHSSEQLRTILDAFRRAR